MITEELIWAILQERFGQVAELQRQHEALQGPQVARSASRPTRWLMARAFIAQVVRKKSPVSISRTVDPAPSRSSL